MPNLRSILILLFIMLPGQWAETAELVNFGIDNLAGESWQLEDIHLEWRFAEDDSVLTLQAKRLQSELLITPLNGLSLSCNRLLRKGLTLHCSNAALDSSPAVLDSPRFAFDFTQAATSMAATIKSLKLAGGEIIAQWQSDSLAERSIIKLDIQALSIEALLAKLGTMIKLPTLIVGGTLSTQITLTQQKDGLVVKVSGVVENAQFSNEEGTQVAQGLTLQFEVTASQEDALWKIHTTLQLGDGEVYSDPVYIELNSAPIQLELDLIWTLENNRLDIEQFNYSHPGVLAFGVQAAATFAEPFVLHHLTLDAPPFSLDAIYRHYLQFLLDDLGFSGLQVNGGVAAKVGWSEQSGTAELTFEDVDAIGDEESFLLSNLAGQVHWHTEQDKALPSQLRWEQGKIFDNLALGGVQLDFILHGNNFELQESVLLEILDGALHVNALDVKDLGGEAQHMNFAGELHPISLQALTKAFNLPELGGQLSGVVPGLQFTENKVEINGALELNIFEGDIVINELTLDKVFSDLPILSMDLAIDNLDLYTLTEFFSFGAITGRVSGYAKKLYMLNWQPIAFDAYLGTSENDESRHRISQKAVQNLSNIGGAGITDILSRSVLSLFEEFRYDKIGWGCVLKDGICQMRGVQSADNGYYIVKGGGLPRIDVLGYNQAVDWTVLVDRLKNVTEIGAPVIE